MPTSTTYENSARRIADLKLRVAALTEIYLDLQSLRQKYQTAADYLELLERQISRAEQGAAWLEFLEAIDMRERYDEIMERAN